MCARQATNSCAGRERPGRCGTARSGDSFGAIATVLGCVNVLLPHPHRVRIMPIEYDTRVGARLAQCSGARRRRRDECHDHHYSLVRYHERTGIGVHVGPKSGEEGSTSPKG